MIKLTNLEKIYRTKEIETVALENVNLDIQKMTAAAVMLVIVTGAAIVPLSIRKGEMDEKS